MHVLGMVVCVVVFDDGVLERTVPAERIKQGSGRGERILANPPLVRTMSRLNRQA